MTLPARYWLVYGDDMTSQMHVQWQEETDGSPDTKIALRKHGDETWVDVFGTSEQHPFTGNDSNHDIDRRLVHRVILDELEPDTVYEFRFDGTSDVLTFETFPTSLGSRKIMFSGDAYSGNTNFANTTATTQQMVARGADAIVVKGDWCYDDGIEGSGADRLLRWDEFWAMLADELTVSGKVIPLIPVIGNHEVVGGYNASRSDGPYFFTFFHFDDTQGAYRAHRAGSWLSVIVIDTEHSTPNLNGSREQELWLDAVLAEPIHYKIPTYHVPFYPGHRDPSGAQQSRLKTHLASRFEANGIRAVMDAHDHVYTRTVRIKDDQPDDDGVVYYGQGTWGVNPRDGDFFNEWYVEEAYGSGQSNGRAFVEAEFTATTLSIRSVNGSTGNVFHEHTEIVEDAFTLQGVKDTDGLWWTVGTVQDTDGVVYTLDAIVEGTGEPIDDSLVTWGGVQVTWDDVDVTWDADDADPPGLQVTIDGITAQLSWDPSPMLT